MFLGLGMMLMIEQWVLKILEQLLGINYQIINSRASYQFQRRIPPTGRGYSLSSKIINR